MNTIEHAVTEVLSEPHQSYKNYWFVDVMSDCYGVISRDSIMCNTYEEAKAVKIGYKYDA